MKRRVVLLGVFAAMVCADQNEALAQGADILSNSSVQRPTGVRRFSGWDNNSMNGATARPLPKADLPAVRAAAKNLGLAQQPLSSRNAVSVAADSGQKRFAGNINSTPLKWAGRLFYREPDGNYRCSAQFVASRVVLTAAHCVRDADTGQWYSDHVFALQYRDGRYSRRFDWQCKSTKQGWVQKGDGKWLWDFAFILVDANSPTGFFGTTWNWEGSYDTAVKIGYPKGISDGERIQVDKGPISVSDGIVELKHGNEADQAGSSGGAWIGKYTTTFTPQSNYVLSHESFSYDGTPGVDYGPYYTEHFNDLFNYTARGCK